MVHASDWHGNFQYLPEADLYVFTGDMLWNHPVSEEVKSKPGQWPRRKWSIDKEHERLHQTKDFAQILKNGGMRRFLASPDAPVVCVRGNHDFVDLAGLFTDCNFVHEFVNNEVVEVAGLRVTGHRGIPYIAGVWNDETQIPELVERARQLPFGVDLVLTHYAPKGILDKAGNHTGLEGLASVLNQVMNWGGVHCFGHIHEEGGRVVQPGMGAVRFSNAACTHNAFDMDPQ